MKLKKRPRYKSAFKHDQMMVDSDYHQTVTEDIDDKVYKEIERNLAVSLCRVGYDINRQIQALVNGDMDYTPSITQEFNL